MKSLKKIIVVILSVMILAATLSVPAMACYDGESDYTEDAGYLAAETIATIANAAIERLVTAAQNQRHPNINRLVRQTNAISYAAISVINMLGIEAECVYETYIVGGVEVEIDPIIIIKRGTIHG